MTDPTDAPPQPDLPQSDEPRSVAGRLGRELAEIAGPFDVEVAQARLRSLGLDAGVARARAVERRERWRWRAIYAVGVFGILYVGFLFGVAVKLGAPKTDVETTASAPASAASVPAVPSVRAVEHEGAASAVLAESPLAAVDAVVPALRGCAALAGERMTVEISIEAGNTTVARFEAVGHDADEVGACVRAVVGGLRFAAPTKAETIIKEVQA